MRSQFVSGWVTDYRTAFPIYNQGIGRVVADLLAADDQGGIGQMHIAAHPAVYRAGAGQDRRASCVRRVQNHPAVGHSGVAAQIAAPDIGVILRAGMAAQSGILGNVSVSANNGFSKQGRALVHIGVIARNRVAKDPGVIPCLERQVALALYKTAQLSGFYLRADIPQRPDTMEEGVLFVGNLRDLIFLIARWSHLLFMQHFGTDSPAHLADGTPRQCRRRFRYD